jgi:uncharacterized protein YgiM (DUF1202 family)
MRSRIMVLLLAAGLLLIAAACGGGPAAPKVPTLAPVPTKTPRPTFTHTPVLPTATRLVPTATLPPTATPVTPSPTVEAVTDTPEAKAMLQANAVANVRSGPGTAYPKIGQLQEGQEYEVTGKNADGDWWQFSFDGKSGWVAASMVTANDAAASVAVAEAPAAPAPVQRAPAPAPAPAPASAPTNPPAAPAKPYAAAGTNPYPGQADRVTVRCRLVADVSKVADRYTNRTGTIRVTGPTSAAPVKFGAYLTWANAGLPKENRYLYQANPDCKVELPFAAGTYTAVILDDSGQEISDPIQFTPSNGTTEFLLVWNPR